MCLFFHLFAILLAYQMYGIKLTIFYVTVKILVHTTKAGTRLVMHVKDDQLLMIICVNQMLYSSTQLLSRMQNY